MRVRWDIPIALSIVAICAWGMIWQFTDHGAPEVAPSRIEPIALGEVLEIDFPLFDMEEVPKPRNLMALYGRRATVLYTWSVPCPCIEDVEPRLRALHERFNRQTNEVRWVALAGEPEDTREEIRAKMLRLGVFYPILRDPDQRICRRLGLVHAGQVAVLDGAGRLVFRGSPDDDYTDGKAGFLETALSQVLRGEPVSPAERERAYGCAFSIPLSCLTLTDEAGGDEATEPSR